MCTQLTQAQETYFSDNFDSEDTVDKWGVTDRDGDGENWGIVDMLGYQNNTTASEFGSQSLVSFSWKAPAEGETGDGTSLDPDNLITSIGIDLTNATGTIVLKFDYGTIEESEPQYVDDHFGVYLTTTNDPNEIVNETPIFEKTFEDYGLQTEVMDISSHAGGMVYLTFRHFDSADNFTVVIDNVEVRQAEEGELSNDEFTFESFNVFPNPVHENLNITFNERGTYKVILTDILGKVVKQLEVSNKNSINIPVTDLNSGNYILNVNSDKKSYSKKVVIQ